MDVNKVEFAVVNKGERRGVSEWGGWSNEILQ